MREVHSPLLKRLVAGGNLLGRRGEGGGGGGGAPIRKERRYPSFFRNFMGLKSGYGNSCVLPGKVHSTAGASFSAF